MRFSTTAIIVTLFALSGSASPLADTQGCKDCPTPPKDDGPVTVQQCGNGDFHCCDQLQSASASSSQGILGLLAAVGQAAVDPATTLGIDCKYLLADLFTYRDLVTDHLRHVCRSTWWCHWSQVPKDRSLLYWTERMSSFLLHMILTLTVFHSTMGSSYLAATPSTLGFKISTSQLSQHHGVH